VPSHLPARTDDHIQIRDILAPVPGFRVLHLPHDIHAIKDLPENDVLAVEEGRGHGGDEELRAVAVGAGVLVFFPVSGEEEGLVVLGYVRSDGGRCWDREKEERKRRGGGRVRYYSHREQPGFCVLHSEVLIIEGLEPVDASRACSVSV
jgi:hypothetical protein